MKSFFSSSDKRESNNSHIFHESDVSSLTTSTYSRYGSGANGRRDIDMNAPIPSFIEILPPNGAPNVPAVESTSRHDEPANISHSSTQITVEVQPPYKVISLVCLSWAGYVGFACASNLFTRCSSGFDLFITLAFLPPISVTVWAYYYIINMYVIPPMAVASPLLLMQQTQNNSVIQFDSQSNPLSKSHKSQEQQTIKSINSNISSIENGKTHTSDEIDQSIKNGDIAVITESNTQLNQVNNHEGEDSRIEGDIDFKHTNPVTLLFGIFIIGILCKLLGIGGGELIMVILHQMNLLPMVSSASCSVLEFSSSLSTTLQNITTNQIEFRFGALYYFIAFFGGGIGRTIGVTLAEKYGLSSFILMTLALVLLISIPVYIYSLVTEPIVFAFIPFCNT